MSKQVVDGNYYRFVATSGIGDRQPWCSKTLRSARPTRAPYIDSAGVPCFVLPRHLDDKLGVQQGDLGFVINGQSKLSWSAIDADTRLPDAIGEGSIMVAKALGIKAHPRGWRGGGVIELSLYTFCKQISPVTIADQDRREDVLPFMGV